MMLEAYIRFPVIGLLIVFAALALRDGWKAPATRYSALLCLSAATLLLGTVPIDLRLPQPVFGIIRFLNIADIAFAWWAGLAMFQDDFNLGKLEWGGFGATVLPVFISRVHEVTPISGLNERVLDSFMLCASIMVMLHLIYVAITGRKDDMIESRRTFRLYFIAVLIFAVLVIVIGERLFIQSYPENFSIFRAIVILPVIVLGYFWLGKVHPEVVAFEPVSKLAPKQAEIDPRDRLLSEQLTQLIHGEKFYTEPGLTIRMLAEKLGAPEHRLRVLINQGLGYRNFSAYLNSHRIRAVQAAMAEPENSRMPILTMAMDVGFNSLAPFNRAFRSETAMTPTAYRKALLSNSDHS